jgi:two-component system NtrC family sensor kinase
MTGTVSGPPRILVADDDEGCRRAVARLLRQAGMEADAVGSIADARAAIGSRVHACVVAELQLPDGAGVELLESLRSSEPDIGRVLLTGSVDYVALQEAVNRAGVHAFFAKPWDAAAVAQGVRGALEQCRLARENRTLVARLADRNAELAGLVVERTAQLERAKRELEAVFDAWDEPIAIVSDGHEVLRANRAYGSPAGLGVREVPGRRCHEVRFARAEPCAGCPMPSARGSGGPAVAAVATADGDVEVEAKPIAVGPHGACLCRYRAAGGR